MAFSAARISASVPLWTAKTSGHSCAVCDGKLHIGHAVLVLDSVLTVAVSGPLDRVLPSPLNVAWPSPLARAPLFSLKAASPAPLALALCCPLTLAWPNPLALAWLFLLGPPGLVLSSLLTAAWLGPWALGLSDSELLLVLLELELDELEEWA